MTPWSSLFFYYMMHITSATESRKINSVMQFNLEFSMTKIGFSIFTCRTALIRGEDQPTKHFKYKLVIVNISQRSHLSYYNRSKYSIHI